jgi:predicted RNA binding protein YcfA (HicA-like mRNA interferase family)
LFIAPDSRHLLKNANRDNEKIVKEYRSLPMPRKIREFKAQIAREGFIFLPKWGKGSHERWRHPTLGKTLIVPGKDEDDVPLYLEN